MFILFSVLSLLFAGCAREKHDISFNVGGAPAEISVWQEVVREFTDTTGIRVKINIQPTDSDLRRQGLVLPLAAKRAEPDVFLMDIAWIGQFAASGWLAPVEISDKARAAFFRGVIETADTYDNRLIGLPVYIDGGLLYYRKDIVKKPPDSWEELVRICVENGRQGENPCFVWQGAQYEGLVCNFLEFALANGGGIIIEGNRADINTAENREALRFMAGLIHKHKVSPPDTYTSMREEESRIAFEESGALFQRNWPYAWGIYSQEGSPVKGKTGIAPLPGFKGKKGASTLGGWHIGISAFSKNKEAALRLVEHITSYDVQKRFAIKMGWNPGREDVYDDKDVLEASPHFKQLKEVFVNASARPNVPYYTRLSSVLQKHLNAALMMKTGAEEALEAAEKEINAIIREYEK